MTGRVIHEDWDHIEVTRPTMAAVVPPSDAWIHEFSASGLALCAAGEPAVEHSTGESWDRIDYSGPGISD